MSKFNLRFWGEILPGRDPAQVKARFAKLFGIEDPVRLERFFSGDDVILRRNLDRKTAAEYFAKLRKLGVEAELVKVAPEASRQAAAAARKRGLVEEAARQRAEHEERQRQAADEAARRQAADEERRRQAAEESARRRAEEDEKKRRAAAEAARRAAGQLERKKQAAEAAARREAQQQERRRRAEEEAARREAEERERRQREEEERARIRAEQQRRDEEERARRRAEMEAAKRKAAEEEARRRDQELERRRKAEEAAAQRRQEEAARRRREEAERERIRAERQRRREAEQARVKAEREEARRKAAETATRKRAEAEQRKRLAAEAAARRRTEEARRQREAAEAAARQRALEEERKRAAAREREERQQRKAEEQARLAAEQEAAARRKREQEERARREAAEKAAAEASQRREEQRRADAEAARAKAEAENLKRRRAEQAGREKAEEQQRRRAEQDAQAAERQAMEAQAIARGAAALGRRSSVRPARGGVRTALPLPSRPSGDAAVLPRRRQPGEPNFYALEPFRNTPEVKSRAARSQQQMKRALQLAIAALALLLIVAGRYLLLSPPPPITGPAGMAIQPGAGPLLLAGDHLLFHDRSGTGTEDLTLANLGLDGLAPPLVFTRRDVLLVKGRLQQDETGGDNWPLLRCDLQNSRCGLFSPGLNDYRTDAIAVHPITGSVFVADATAGEILKFDSEGVLQARSAAPVPPAPVVRLDSGLLFLNSGQGPAIGVFRHEEEAFAQQLDEVLLLPPAAVNTGQSRVGNFIRVGAFWWVYLFNPDDGNGDLFRFDGDWAFVDEVPLPPGLQAQQMAGWNGKLLVADSMHQEIQRFSGAGTSEAPLASDLLRALAAERRQSAGLSRLLWRGILATCTLLATAALGGALFLRLRSMVYRTSRERGAEPVDELLDGIQWVDPVAGRDVRLRRLTHLYLAGAALILGSGVALTVEAADLLALLLALAGPALALALLRRDPIGHIGAIDEQLLLVDHRHVYHLGGGSRIQYRGPFLLIDDVVVFTGLRWLPAFSADRIQALVAPLRSAGVRVDRTTIAVKLLQCRHALAAGTLATLAGFAAALALTLLRHL